MPNRKQSGEDVLAEKRLKMPSALADVHYWLCQETSWLHLHWREFKVIYATSEKRVQLLNATAPRFFARFEQASWHDTLLRLCRLTDSPKSSGRNNLTIRQLPSLISERNFADEVSVLVDVAVAQTKFARDWRNRKLAHHDLDRALKPELHPLEETSRAQIEMALKALRDVLNSIELKYQNSTTSYEHTIADATGAEALLYFLSSGLDAEETRIESGCRWKPAHY